MAPPVLTLTGRCIVLFQVLSDLTFQDLATEIPFTSKQPRVLRSPFLVVKSEGRFFGIPFECALGCMTLCGTCTKHSRLSSLLPCHESISQQLTPPGTLRARHRD